MVLWICGLKGRGALGSKAKTQSPNVFVPARMTGRARGNTSLWELGGLCEALAKDWLPNAKRA